MPKLKMAAESIPGREPPAVSGRSAGQRVTVGRSRSGDAGIEPGVARSKPAVEAPRGRRAGGIEM